MGKLTAAEIQAMREWGDSEYKIRFYDAENQNGYKSLLLDPNTPKKIIYDIVHYISFMPLKLLAIKHKNISPDRQRYILSTASRSDFKLLVESIITTDTTLNTTDWNELRTFNDGGNRFNTVVYDLINADVDITVENLGVILNSLTMSSFAETDLHKYIEAIINHKNFDVSILNGKFFVTRTKNMMNLHGDIIDVINKSKNKDLIYEALFLQTGDLYWASESVKSIFMF